MKYLDDYADHFKLKQHCRFGIKVDRLDRSRDDATWELHYHDRDSEAQVDKFDRVVVTTGAFTKAWMPNIEGSENFRGQILHSQAFKGAEDFKGKHVVVVGLSQTGGDVVYELCEHAEKVYLSHRSGGRISIRNHDAPVDRKLSRRITAFGLALNKHAPNFAGWIASKGIDYQMRKTFPNIDPAWKLLPAPPIGFSPPVMNDHLMDRLASGAVTSITGINHITPSSEIILTDGTSLPSIDAIVFCTGYTATYSMLSPEADPTAFPQPEWEALPNKNGLVYPRLYRGHCSTKYPLTLAFIGPYTGHSFAAFVNGDLSTQAIAQVWKGAFALPPQAQMEAWCDANYAHQLARLKVSRIPKVGFVDVAEQERWLNAAAGNGINEMLGWSWEAWRFWFKNRKVMRSVTDGVDTPFVYRLFDARETGEGRKGRGRKKWEGAEAAILKTAVLVARPIGGHKDV